MLHCVPFLLRFCMQVYDTDLQTRSKLSRKELEVAFSELRKKEAESTYRA